MKIKNNMNNCQENIKLVWLNRWLEITNSLNEKKW